MRRFMFLASWFCPAAALAADDFKLNAQEYFERPGINVMYGQDYYPEGHQGGLSIIMHDERIASNGDVRLEPSPGQWSPIPKPGKREANAATQEIRVALAYPDAERDRKGFNPIVYPDLKLNYTVRARPEGRVDPRQRRFRRAHPEGVGRQGGIQSRAVPGTDVRQVVPARRDATACSSGSPAVPAKFRRSRAASGSKSRRRPSSIT